MILSLAGAGAGAALLFTAALPPVQRLQVDPGGIVCGVTAPQRASGRATGLILWFHGGMRSGNREKGLEAHRQLLPFVDPEAWILASPSAFAGRDWLGDGAMETTEALIDSLARRFAFDTSNINLVGVSDGCLAVIRYGSEGRRMARRKVLVSTLPQLVLSPEALAGRRRLAEGRWDFLQGGQDRLFPAQAVLPFIRQWESLYPNAHVHYFQEGEHDFGYYAVHASALLRSFFPPDPDGGRKDRTPKTQKGPPNTKLPKKNLAAPVK